MGEVVYKGVPYKSRRALCEALGFPSSTLNTRMADGWSLERALETPIRTTHKVTKLTINGVTYPSKQAAYDAYGISKSAVRDRLESGMSLIEAITTPYVPQRITRTYDGKKFTSLGAVAEYLKCPRTAFRQFLEEADTFEEACTLAKAYVKEETMSPEEVAAYNCTVTQYHTLRKRLDGNMASTKEWLTKIFLEYPTQFHGVEYISVQSACEDLGIRLLQDVRSRMLNLLEFQAAVHELYYVYENKVYTNPKDLRSVMGISRPAYEELIKKLDNPTHDAIVQACVDSGLLNTTTVESSSLRISRGNKDVSSAISCRNGDFVVYCEKCGRPLYLTEEEALSFAHDDDFCKNHTISALWDKKVTATRIREQIRRKGSWEAALAVYAKDTPVLVTGKINKAVTASGANKDFTYVRCNECGKCYLQRRSDALSFTHERCSELMPVPEGWMTPVIFRAGTEYMFSGKRRRRA